MDSDERAPDRKPDTASEQLDETRQWLARTAEDVAWTLEHSAAVHADLAADRPEAAEHAERDRRLAAAALRDGEPPPDAARQDIRDGGRDTGGERANSPSMRAGPGW